ncbi:MAG: OmpH family outer membrane protein [Tepidimonas ignava]|uniref:Chaperone protein Skp n=1 Tax=Tepidimonas ignava TaxID=114249 RepID=A0A4R3LNB1_9BURK|nr:OmpH family outer membrane protein [Tepidimonas ignava]MCX7814315.1 OmpH family outer membrane protein [Tepidimonas ignava]TCS99416.1 periplasmic chaperone for outer membrane proteins Skp [Tepidimonas ignava]TSE24243.1 Chaperone protein Skp [Tepidimonas ignava]
MISMTRHWGARVALVAALAAAGAASWAQDLKIGFVSTERILRDSNAAKAAQARLEQEFSKRERDLEALGNQLRQATEKLEKDAPTLSESQRSARQRQLAELERDFQRRRREFQEDLAQRRNEELQQVIERANRVIKQIAESEKYDLILQEAVYIAPKHDITDKVINGLNNAR